MKKKSSRFGSARLSRLVPAVQASHAGEASNRGKPPMSSDPRLHHAANWISRFCVNGVAVSDFNDVLASLTSWDDWCRAWSARAKVHEDLGRAALADRQF